MLKNHVWKVAAVCIVFLSASMAAHAAEVPWTYVEAGYLNNDPEEIDGSGDNWFLGGAFGGKMWHVFAEYQQGDFVENIDNKNWKLGAGWHGLLGERADLLAELAYLQNMDPFDEDGFGATVGVRWRIIKMFEVDGFVNYVDFGDLGDDTTGELRAILYVWRIGIGASYEGAGDLADQYTAFVRFNFGKN